VVVLRWLGDGGRVAVAGLRWSDDRRGGIGRRRARRSRVAGRGVGGSRARGKEVMGQVARRRRPCESKMS
jgi:hypothetical protein